MGRINSAPFNLPLTEQGQVRAPPSSPRLGMWWVASPCEGELFLLAAGGWPPCPAARCPAQLGSELRTTGEASHLGRGSEPWWDQAQVWLKVGTAYLAGAVREGGTQVRGRRTGPTPLRVLSLRTVIAPVLSGRIFLSLSRELGVRIGVPLGRCCFLAVAQEGAV